MSDEALMRGVSFKLFDAAAAAVGNSASVALLPRASLVTWQTYFGTNPGAVEIQIQTSNDDTNWFTTDSSTEVAGEVGTFQTSAKHIRARIESITDGAEVTVEIVAKPL
jgi:streptogramin lyase